MWGAIPPMDEHPILNAGDIQKAAILIMSGSIQRVKERNENHTAYIKRGNLVTTAVDDRCCVFVGAAKVNAILGLLSALSHTRIVHLNVCGVFIAVSRYTYQAMVPPTSRHTYLPRMPRWRPRNCRPSCTFGVPEMKEKVDGCIERCIICLPLFL